MNWRQKRIFFLAVLLGFAALAYGITQFAANAEAEAAPAPRGTPGSSLKYLEEVGFGDLVKRPDPEGTPTKVIVGLYVIDVGDIDDVKQTFEANFAVGLKWKDPKLATGKKGVVKRYDLEEIWTPHALILNRRELTPIYPDYVTVDDVGNVLYSQRFYGHLGFHLHLRNFPLDEHVLPIEIVSGRYGPYELEFINSEKLTGQSENLSVADWEILEGHSTTGTYYFKPLDKYFSTYTYKMDVERKAGFFLWRVVAPLLLIVFMSWMVFYIDPSHLEAQVGISATSVLTLVAFQFAVGVLLPRISYLTRMDFFVLLTSFMVFAALVEGVTTSGLATSGRKDLALRIDRYSRIIFPLVFVASILIVFLI